MSMATVSRVLNGRSGVAEDTRARVEELLHAHGYNRRGSGRQTHLVELVFDRFDSEWALEMIRGTERVAKRNGLSIVITESGDRHEPARDWIDRVLERRPVGVILVLSDVPAASKRQLRMRNIPFVIIDPTGDPAPDVPSVGASNWSGGVQATRHLVDLGHRDIAIMTGPDDVLSSRARLFGFRAVMDAAGIAVPPEFIRTGGYFSQRSGLVVAQELLALERRPTAIFAESDLQALGVYQAARARGLRVPDDLSVVGFDDLPLAAWVGPPLTTVHQPIADMAEQAARLLLALRDGVEGVRHRVELLTHLVVRESTAPPRS